MQDQRVCAERAIFKCRGKRAYHFSLLWNVARAANTFRSCIRTFSNASSNTFPSNHQARPIGRFALVSSLSPARSRARPRAPSTACPTPPLPAGFRTWPRLLKGAFLKRPFGDLGGTPTGRPPAPGQCKRSGHFTGTGGNATRGISCRNRIYVGAEASYQFAKSLVRALLQRPDSRRRPFFARRCPFFASALPLRVFPFWRQLATMLATSNKLSI